MEARIELFETMPVKRAVIKQILPAIISQMIALIYNLADTYFVGLLNSPEQTASITVAYPAFVMLTAISNLFGVGGASALARALGKHDCEKAGIISSISFYGGLLSSVVTAIMFFVLARPILTLCGATDSTYHFAYGYAKWIVIIGGTGTVLNVLTANLIRAEGNAVIAAVGVSLGGLFNIALDPFFVLPQYLNLGAEGAGMATAISNFVAAAFLTAFVTVRKSAVSLRLPTIRNVCKYIGTILSVGFPSALQYALTVVAVAAQARFVSGYATEAVAALGIVKKLDQLPLYFSIGVANGLLPMLAYNYSSGNHKRRQRAFGFGCSISFGFAMLCLICYEIFAPHLISLFISDAQTVKYGASFLRIMVTAMPLMAVCYPMIIQFQAMGRVRESLLASILRKGVIDIPLLYIMNMLLPLYGCMMVQPIVDGISLIASAVMYARINKMSRTVPISCCASEEQ